MAREDLRMDLANVSRGRRWAIVFLLFTASLINYLDRAAISSAADNQGAAAFFFLLVVRAHANAHWLVRRPFEFAVALCGSFCAVVLGTGTNRLGGESCNAGWFSHPSGYRGVHLSARRVEDRQLAVLQQRPWFTFRAFRFWDPHGIGSRMNPFSLASRALRLAPHLSPFGLRGFGLVDSLVFSFSSPNGCGEQRISFSATSDILRYQLEGSR